MKVLGKYKNGNYTGYILEDGTKIRHNTSNVLSPEKPESIDLKITNYCDVECPFCHEGSNKKGIHADIMNLKFIDTLLPFTELAIGGGNPLSHPDLIPFLKKCKDKNIICNITVNQFHFLKEQKLIRYLVDNNLIKGLGLSLTLVTSNLLDLIKSYDNIVIHLINGVHKLSEIEKLYDKNLKILILGYKEFRRGKTYYSKDIIEVKNNISSNLKEILNHFKVVSFDNLALKQLNIKELLTEEEWNTFYMGDDGSFTMYIDAVKKQYCKSSITEIDKRKSLSDDIKKMFKNLK